MKVKELIKELENFDGNTEVEVMVDGQIMGEVTGTSGDDEEGVAIECHGED